MPTGLRLLAGTPPALSTWSNRSVPPLGAAVVAPLSLIDILQEELVQAVHTWPWCPVVLIADTPTLGRELLRLVLLTVPRNPAIFPATSTREHPPEALRAAIRCRSAVTPEEIVEYLARRGVSRSAQGEIALALGEPTLEALDAPASPGTRTQSQQHVGRLTGADWRAVLALLGALERGLPPPHQRAGGFGLDLRALQYRARQYLGRELDEAVALPGWEWKLETVLRRFGYVFEPGGEWSNPERPQRSAM